MVLTRFGMGPTAAAMAKRGTTRPLDHILKYAIMGVSLNIHADPVDKILTAQGFSLVGESYPDRLSRQNRRKNVGVGFDERFKGDGLTNNAVTENATDGHFDLFSTQEILWHPLKIA